MVIAGIVLGCLVLGYAFAECGRYVLVQRNEAETALRYPRGRLARRLLISALALFECGILIFWDPEIGGEASASGNLPAGVSAMGVLLLLFILLWRDFHDVRGEIRHVRAEISRDLEDALHTSGSLSPSLEESEPGV